MEDDLLREESLGFREVPLSQVVSGHESELMWRGLCGRASQILMSTRWCPVTEITEGEVPRSGVISFTVVSLNTTNNSKIVPSITLALTDPGLAEAHYRHAWKSSSISRKAAARKFHLGAGNIDFDLAIHGGGMLRFSAGQQQLEVSLQDKLTQQTWSQTVTMAEMRSPQTISLIHHQEDPEVVKICLKFKIFGDI